MIRKIISFLILGILTIGMSVSAKPRPIDSVQALQINNETFCTAFSINAREGYWASAAHCATHALDKVVTIQGQPAHVVYIGFPSSDIAVFQSHTKAPALKLAAHAVPQCLPTDSCEAIHIIGYPYGIARIVTRGSVGARDISFLHPGTGYWMMCDVLDITVAGGNSGSPVLNSKGEVIGVLWGRFSMSPHSLAVPLAAVKTALQRFVS